MRGSTSRFQVQQSHTQYDQMMCHNNIALVGRERDADNDDIGDEDDDNTDTPLHIRSWKTQAPGASAYSVSQSENTTPEEPRCPTDSGYAGGGLANHVIVLWLCPDIPLIDSALELPLDLDHC